MIGGCCGTEPTHIAALDQMLRKLEPKGRPAVKSRSVVWVPAVAALYGQVPLRQENAYLSIGERCNANGSKPLPGPPGQHDLGSCGGVGGGPGRGGPKTPDGLPAVVGRHPDSR